MYYKCSLALVSLLSVMIIMNLKGVQTAASYESTVLHFEPSGKPTTMSNSTCTNPKYYCSENLTCCSSQDNRMFGCCPIPQGVCCIDGIHCCPPDSKCDMIKGHCYMQNKYVGHMLITTDWNAVQHTFKQENLLQKPTTMSNSTCTNPKFYCSENLTCCSSQDNRTFGCCPIPQGVCCIDGIHCCPPDSKCDMLKRHCYMQNKYGHKLITTDWNAVQCTFRQENLLQKVSAEVVCPGGSVSCPDGSTCCKSASGSYQCCPFPQALCCSDHVHCCPKNYKCNISSGACTKDSDVVNWMMKQPAKSTINLMVNSVVCPGGRSQCPDGTTCCKMQSGQYGCCPYQKAVCCSDGLHCCPDGYKCDVSAGKCARSDDILIRAIQNQTVTTKESVMCDEHSECPSGNTCCKLASGQYGCCPLIRAFCCIDRIHCCPQGYQCNAVLGTCQKGDDILAWVTKKPSRPAN